MSEIRIDGLNARQRGIADILWAMDGRDQVEAFIKSLRGPYRREAELVVEMMLLSLWDTVDTVDKSTQELIDNCR